MPRLAIYLLGPPLVELDGNELHIPRRKALALLACLAVEKHPHRRDSLAAFLWPEYDQSGARGRLRRTLSSLNRCLGEGYLDADRENVELVENADLWLDVDAFQKALSACETHAHLPGTACTECQAWLEEAVALYRDDFLTGFSLPDSLAFDDWARYQSQHLQKELGGALERLADILAVQGLFDDAITHSLRWLSLDLLREAAHRCLMRLYALSDQEPAALRQFQRCQRTLKEELGVPPSPQTVELMARIRAGESLERAAEPRPRVPHNLPPQPTRFVGREKELKQLGDLIADPDVRLITIVGPGGIGKTRLALTVAERVLNRAAPAFLDGVFFVPLAQISGSEELAPVVAEALSFQLGGPEESRTARQQVLDFLREKRILLVLDNFEHLLGSTTQDRTDHGAGFIADVLRTAPEVQLLVTSRERLPLREEQAFLIAGLESAGEETDDAVKYAAAQLFLQAARRAERSFELAAGEVATLTRICRLLEGMPLAIELAAAWVDVLPLADIASEIQRGLDFLATEWQDAPERHRSVRAAIDASWRRLTERERTTFAQLCVFRGGFTREAAREVAGADLRTLANLVEKSLLSFSREQERYDVHELLRQYGSDRLAADPELERAAHDRHSAFFCDALGCWGDAINRGKPLEANVDFVVDWANLSAALVHAADYAEVERLDLALHGFLFLTDELSSFGVGERVFQRVIAGLTEKPRHRDADTRRVLAKTWLFSSQNSLNMGRRDLSSSSIKQSKALLEDPALAACDTRDEQAWLHIQLAQQAVPDAEEARCHFQYAQALHRELGYDGQVALRVMNIGAVYAASGHPDEAIRYLEEALDLLRAGGNPYGQLYALVFLGNIAHSRGLPEAEGYYSEVVKRARDLNRPGFQLRGLLELGINAILRGNYDKAEKLLLDCREIAHQYGILVDRCTVTRLLGETAWFRGDVDVAERRLTEALGLARQTLFPGEAALTKRWLSYIACAARDFDRAEALCKESLASLQEHDLFERGVLGMALACIALFRGEPTQAVERFKECLQDLRPNLSWGDTIRALEGVSWALAALDRYYETARLLGFLNAERERIGFVLPPVDRPHHENALNAACEGLGEQAFSTAWESGAALTLEEAVDLALEFRRSVPSDNLCAITQNEHRAN